MVNQIFIAESLDGFIADVDGNIDWLNEIPDSGKTDDFSRFMDSIDVIIMGRRTFETVQSFGLWPYKKPVIVLSRSIRKLPPEYQDKATVSSDKIKPLMEKLNNKGYRNIYIDGGKVIQNFLDMDIVDKMIITRVPIILGDGIPLFGKLKNKIKFKHTETKTLSNGLTTSTYIRDR